MPFITFIAKNRRVGSFALRDGCILGRSLDADVFVPDMFVSRAHCKFHWDERGWTITDLDSRNGLYFNGRRVPKRVLHDGDTIEIGTIAVIFCDEDLPANKSNPAPLGENFPLIELVDTVFTGKMRPSQFTKKARRIPAWKRKQLADRVSLDDDIVGVPAPEPVEWTELDVEFQLAEAAETAQPAFVLVPAELAGMLQTSGMMSVAGATLSGTGAALTTAGSQAIAVSEASNGKPSLAQRLRGGANRPARIPPGSKANPEPDDGAAIPLAADRFTEPSRHQVGPRTRNLWDMAKTPRKVKEPEPEPEPSMAEVRMVDGVLVMESGLTDRLQDSTRELWQWLRKANLRDIIDAFREKPRRIVVAAAVFLALGGGIATVIRYTPSSLHYYTGDPADSPSLPKSHSTAK